MSTAPQCFDAPASAGTRATRVLLMASKSSLRYTQSWFTTNETLATALDALKSSRLIEQRDTADIPTRLLVKHKGNTRVFIIFDISNNDYNPAFGHLPKSNNLPVLVVHFSKDQTHTRVAEVGLRDRVNKETGNEHNRNGIGSVPPFIVDYTTNVAPVYMNPRDPSLL
jgi:hypothetical protein